MILSIFILIESIRGYSVEQSLSTTAASDKKSGCLDAKWVLITFLGIISSGLSSFF
jgi:hypothetical protein